MSICLMTGGASGTPTILKSPVVGVGCSGWPIITSAEDVEALLQGLMRQAVAKSVSKAACGRFGDGRDCSNQMS